MLPFHGAWVTEARANTDVTLVSGLTQCPTYHECLNPSRNKGWCSSILRVRNLACNEGDVIMAVYDNAICQWGTQMG